MQRLTPLGHDLQGRIRNLNWKPSSQWAMPILKAVSNSLHATQHLSSNQREIRITLIREGDNRNTLLKEIQRERHIIGFRIEDNGIGFNDTNFEAFQTLDTRNKQSFGGKGIGRLFWLKAFSAVSINSTYQKENETYSRNILFTAEGIAAEESKLANTLKIKQ